MAMSTGKVIALIQAMGGGADPAVIKAAVQDWLDAHPEATTTVQDGSITEQKLATSIAQKLGLISSLSDEIDDVKDITTVNVTEWNPVELELQNGYYSYSDGAYTADHERRSAKITVSVGDTYKLSTFTRPTTISGLIYFGANDAVISHTLDGTGTATTITDYEFTIPNGVISIVVQSANRTTLPTLYKKSELLEFAGYTKAETDAKFALNGYGVRWSISDPDDLGQRVGKAAGMTAVIGEGSTNGHSDFDNIYPWSQIKRCNIKTNANGADVVTFEGESGFALDGSNGDVFVRIPKFYTERYVENGYEYLFVSESGANPHRAFIENGKEIDAIYVGAFEGYSDGTKLHSYGGVLPTSNITRTAFLALATANGTNYSLYDMRCVDALWTLMAVEYGCRNSNHILGYGIADFEQASSSVSKDRIITAGSATNIVRTQLWTTVQKAYLPVGSNITVCKQNQDNILTQAKITACVDGTDYTDWTFDGNPIDVDTDCFIGSAAFSTNWCENAPSGNLSWHTGRCAWFANDTNRTKNTVRYRWVENPIGNLWHLLPDVLFKNLQMYECENMSDYNVGSTLTNAYKPVGDLLTPQTSNGDKSDTVGNNFWISALINDPFAKGNCFGKTFDKSLTSKQAFGGYYYLSEGSDVRSIAQGGGFDHLWRCNMITNRAWTMDNTMWYLYGSRLMYKHLV